MLEGKAAGEEAGVGRPRLRDVSHRVLEKDALPGQRVEGGGGAGGRAVGAHAVGPEGVDGDEEQVRGGRRAGGGDEQREGSQHLQPRLSVK